MDQQIVLTTMVVVLKRNRQQILMLDRKHGNWTGYTPPGGHVEECESLTECAIREVKEETGLTVWDLSFKGLAHFVDEKTKQRYMVFSYLTDKYKGELYSKNNTEGKPKWIKLAEIDRYDLAPGIKKRLELFFSDKITELYVVTKEQEQNTVKEIVI